MSDAVAVAMTGTTPPRFLTPQEVGGLVGLNRGQLHDLRRAGEGPAYYTIGSSIRYLPADVEAWQEQRRGASR